MGYYSYYVFSFVFVVFLLRLSHVGPEMKKEIEEEKREDWRLRYESSTIMDLLGFRAIQQVRDREASARMGTVTREKGF